MTEEMNLAQHTTNLEFQILMPMQMDSQRNM